MRTLFLGEITINPDENYEVMAKPKENEATGVRDGSFGRLLSLLVTMSLDLLPDSLEVELSSPDPGSRCRRR